jgi:hypothetical protein
MVSGIVFNDFFPQSFFCCWFGRWFDLQANYLELFKKFDICQKLCWTLCRRDDKINAIRLVQERG